jgi:ketosteroid isomerase-like protein
MSGLGSEMNHDEGMRMIRAITAAFDEHDLDEIMAHFADDAVFESPRGPDPWGQRFLHDHAVSKGPQVAAPDLDALAIGRGA